MPSTRSFGVPNIRGDTIDELRQAMQLELERLYTHLDQLAGLRGTPTFYNAVNVNDNRLMHVSAPIEDTDGLPASHAISRRVGDDEYDADGRRIRNVAPGTDGDNAVNMDQLHNMELDMSTIADATFIVVSSSPALSQDRQLAVEALVLALTDAGANSTITISVLANGITFAKIQQIATDRLVGRDTAGTGNLEQLTVGNGLEFTGAGGIGVANNGVTDARLRDSAAVSVIGRSANSSGDPADIAAAANDQALMRQSDALAFAVPTAGVHSLWIPAQAMTPSLTAGATMSHLEMTTNDNNYITLSFANTGTPEYAEWQIAMPKKWNEGTLTYQVYWTLNSTSTATAAFGLQAVAISNDDPLDVAFDTPVVVTDSGLGTAYDLHVSAVSGALTVAGTPADSDMVTFRVSRDSGHVSDTLAVTVELLGVKVFWTTDATTDA